MFVAQSEGAKAPLRTGPKTVADLASTFHGCQGCPPGSPFLLERIPSIMLLSEPSSAPRHPEGAEGRNGEGTHPDR